MVQEIGAALVINLTIYGLAAVSGCTNLYKWRGMRTGIIGLISMAAASLLSGISYYSPFGLLLCFILLCWTIPFAWVRGHALSSEDKDFSRLKSEYLFGASLVSTCLFIPVLGEWGQFAISIIVPLVMVFTLTAVGSNLWYFSKYHNVFQSADMIPVLLTNKKEAYEFIVDEIGISKLSGYIALCLAALGVLYNYHSGLYIDAVKTEHFYLVLFCLLGFGVMAFKYMMASYPIKYLREAGKSIAEMKRISLIHGDNIKKLKADKNKAKSGTTVLIIGESANKNHMKAFNNNYSVDTTPWETERKKDPDFYFFDKVYACFTQTAQVLSYLLTGMNQYNHKDSSYMVSLVDIAKSEGMDTWWISNQGANDALTMSIAEEADYQLWTAARQGDDSQILDMLSKIPDKGNHFVVIHLMGSHIRYKDRVPERYRKTVNHKLSDYDMSILYTDHILEKIYDFLINHIHPDSIMYISDHGEDMKYTHGTGHFTFDMVRVPCWIYLCPDLKDRRPELDRNLSCNHSKVFTNDLIFDTMSGLMGIKTFAYSPQYDMTSDIYNLPVEEARTMHGKVNIESDVFQHKERK